MKQLQTTNCIICGRPAEFYSGHVHDGKKIVTAGFCNQHPRGSRKFSYHPTPGCAGCFGRYKKDFGLMLETVR